MNCNNIMKARYFYRVIATSVYLIMFTFHSDIKWIKIVYFSIYFFEKYTKYTYLNLEIRVVCRGV